MDWQPVLLISNTGKQSVITMKFLPLSWDPLLKPLRRALQDTVAAAKSKFENVNGLFL